MIKIYKKEITVDILEKQKKEIDFWRTSPTESPSQFTIENIVNKISEAKRLLNKFNKYKELFNNNKIILELGGGQGWASCILKKNYLTGQAIVINSDISKYAVQSAYNWERIFEINIENIVCRCYEIPVKSNSIDIIFTFQAAHHFYKHRSTIKEIYRILKDGGVCLYLSEPSCMKYIYPLAYKRVNKKRPDVAEDVLIHKEISYLAEKIGFSAKTNYETSFINRNPIETIYYYILNKIKILRYFLPCEMDYIFIKPKQTSLTIS